MRMVTLELKLSIEFIEETFMLIGRKCWRAMSVLLVGILAGHAAAADAPQLQSKYQPVYRPPAVPLVVHNPLLSIWSCANNLTDDTTRHWTRHPNSLGSLIRVDGQSYRLMGIEPHNVPAFPQSAVKVLPTRTIYDFENPSVHVTLTFLTPMLPTDVELVSRPLTYLTWDVKAVDGKAHTVSVLFSAGSDMVVDSTKQKVVWEQPNIQGMTALKMGSKDQPYVERAGDDSRIDWGYAYIASNSAQSKGAIGSAAHVLQAFANDGALPVEADTRQPRAANDEMPTMALAMDFGQVSTEPVTRRAMIAYDDVYAVDYFGKKCRGIWRNKPGMDGDKLLLEGDQQYADLLKRSIAFDDELMTDCRKMGGDNYAYICALAYRQSLGGCGLASDPNGQPMQFAKENTSDGNMATVDVLFPMGPINVLLSPTLTKACLAPVFVYSASDRWKWPNAPHDLGEYPIAFGRDDGGEGMPVEESGNMIILADAVSQIDGNTKFVDAWWPKVTQWAHYLEQYGADPEEQLCTDDFKGRLAHNANLSVKAIVALAAFGDMCKIRGDAGTAERYMNMAREDAKHWVDVDSEGDHFKLAFDKTDSWGQNYNMVWDRILGLNVFPADVYKKQIAFYKTQLQPYGLPLDSRDHLTKTDWSVWTASMADNQSDFETLTDPIVKYLDLTPVRMPFVDSYMTDNLDWGGGMHARPVIGGVFARMLSDRDLWMKWAHRDKEVVGTYSLLPLPPLLNEIVPTSDKKAIVWSYTTTKPADNWFNADFDDSSWKKGPAGFGRGDSHPNTQWTTDDIWIRRDFDMPEGKFANLKFLAWHDEDMEIYINGVLAGSASEYNTSYSLFPITADGLAALKPGKNVMAVHCHQTVGGQFIDVGIADVTER
jgi:hypothetical protein